MAKTADSETMKNETAVIEPTEQPKEIVENKEKEQVAEVEETYIYLGPTLNTGLKENAILRGTRTDVEQYLKPSIEKYPQIKSLLVPTSTMILAKIAVKKQGTILNKYYVDILSLSTANKEEG